MLLDDPERTARRRLGRLLIAGVAGLAVGLSGCAIVPPAGSPAPSPPPSASTTPDPSIPVSPTAPVTSSPTAEPEPTESATPTPSPTPSTTAAAVKATGNMLTYSNLVSDQLAGTCQTTKQTPTFTLSDAKNDFYGTVDVVVALEAGREAVTSVRADFGEDFEGTTRRLSHPESGTSATVSAKGSTYTVKGKLRMYEGSSKSGTLVPFTLVVECAGDNW